VLEFAVWKKAVTLYIGGEFGGRIMQPIKELNLINQGKVRDLYDLGESLLIVTTDRISIYDVILPDPVQDKGKVLTRISEFWFDHLSSITKHHLITTDIDQMPDVVQPFKAQLEGRSMLVKKAKPLPVECIVRGYLTGSGFKDYLKTGSVCGIPLPAGLKDSAKLPEVLFTPSTKAEIGEHDENISFEAMKNLIGAELAEKVKQKSIEIYTAGAKHALSKGIIIADTKFEFGLIDNELILIDEVLTPDSSRFWPADSYAVGKTQDSFDKQYVRDFYTNAGWDKKSKPQPMPAEVAQKTSDKYHQLEKIITG
jgi:phosphoribosylaminoimidazole-succinocarboxamide synthase